MPSWDPGQYVKFLDERTRPSRDLCARIDLAAPARVLDLGCGPGNSTRVLAERWPGADLAGLDSSPEMIAQARSGHPDGAWILADAATYEPAGQWDVVFSNAALQWLPDHPRLLPRLLGWVAPGGCLAVQMPARDSSPFRDALRATAQRPRWRDRLGDCSGSLTFLGAGAYYDLLAPLVARLDLWETLYYHVLDSHQGLVDWYAGTGMRPYLDRLPDPADRAAFQAEVLEGCREAYPVAGNGRVLMPFRRLFFVAVMASPQGR
jgi:trans-aconitate 2-methyltransferase